MHARSLLRAAGLLAFLAAPCALSAQNPNPGTPSGTQGHDWDAVSFVVSGDHVAVVTAANISTGDNSSSAGFEVWLDGTRIDNYTTSGFVAAKAYLVRGSGRHNLLVRCTNHVASMVSCRANAMRADEGAVF